MKFSRIVCAAVLLLTGGAAAQDGGKAIQKTTISLGTATPGGGFPLYGNAFAEIINAAGSTLSIEPRVALVCLTVAAAIGLVSSFVPAWSASRTPIVEALRRND